MNISFRYAVYDDSCLLFSHFFSLHVLRFKRLEYFTVYKQVLVKKTINVYNNYVFFWS